ncbi:MAG TPA: Gfo/Idh/MocA family oxidoreductase [Candidatus Acidoferrales bacterium]|nr:Gfo/Idh/MocA family oxidoreductase [Candidatus Acidoferrales bacterium]
MAQALRIGVAGLGDAGSQVVQAAASGVPGIELAAVADTRADAVQTHKARYAIAGFGTVEEMCRSDAVDAVYIATPNKFHVEHALAAIENGKHLIVVKPLALTLEDSDRMIAAADRGNVKLVYGHSRIYDPPVQKMAEIVRSGELGRLIQINTWMYGGWLQRKPRLASELSTDSGGGVVYRQAPHQADIVRWIGGGLVKWIRGITGRWDPNFAQTEGNYTAFAELEDGTPVTMVMNGYGYFSTAELTHGMAPPAETVARRTAAADEQTKYRDAGRRDYFFASDERKGQPFYGLTIVSCEKGDIRQSLNGLYVYTADGWAEIDCPRYPGSGRASVTGALLALRDAVRGERKRYPDGRWAKATLEVCLALLRSDRERREVRLEHQVPTPW